MFACYLGLYHFFFLFRFCFLAWLLLWIISICQGLFLGSIGDANNKDALKSSNVTHVLTVANLGKPPFPNDFVYKVVEGLVVSL